ncbi:hypothetical protein SAMN02745121_03857 [Nannocystis exedens]|uniref:Uncharacterized protein n=1 Tax=Nannocystis exedens TaxID=54 RepID=A0A1I1ZMP2_9BACT|nr:hypothetical protein [Nannocystis exedens]PCC75416.1 hypothetical protein NAEX_08526 [Nannocystis exedens]SFE32925.1 hypothetical protein SAMN02745121_03857 [Nannocystis exedens]
MPRSIHRLFLFLAFPLVLACEAPRSAPGTPPLAPPAPSTAPAPADSDEPLLRTYTVPPEQARSIEQALASALSTGKDLPPLGTVERLPDGRLVVVAPPGIQDGVAALIAGLDPAKAPPVRTAEFDYWIVVGEPAQAAEGVDAVPDIAPALQAIVASQGPMRFRLHESMHLSSLIDERAEADGALMQARQTVSEVGGRLVADLNLVVAQQAKDRAHLLTCAEHCNQLRSRIHVDPGQLLVVGQASLEASDAKAQHVPKTMFYIVRGQLRTGGV